MTQDRVLCQVGSVDFAVCGLESAVERTVNDAASGRRAHIHLANAWSIVLASDDLALRDAFHSGVAYPDGKPVVWVMRWMCRRDPSRQPGRVYGPLFFERTLDIGRLRDLRHYFLGSTPETLVKLQESIRARFAGINIVGSSSPPFRDLTSADLAREVSMIEAAKPHIVWVGLGTPKQDLVAASLANCFPAVFACVGAAFDFTAGNLRDVPLWAQEAGLAWLFRFAQEPRRLWRRYTYGNARFVKIAISAIWKN